MSAIMGETNGVKARKPYSCTLCGEAIAVGELYDKRTGTHDEGWWTMRMHPECHAYEHGHVDWEWYEDGGGEPAFNRSDAMLAARATKGSA